MTNQKQLTNQQQKPWKQAISLCFVEEPMVTLIARHNKHIYNFKNTYNRKQITIENNSKLIQEHLSTVQYEFFYYRLPPCNSCTSSHKLVTSPLCRYTPLERNRFQSLAWVLIEQKSRWKVFQMPLSGNALVLQSIVIRFPTLCCPKSFVRIQMGFWAVPWI